MTHSYYVVVLAIRPNGGNHELLMVRRTSAKYLGDTWQLISGGLEPEEVAWKAGLRELREETGLVPGEFYRLSTLTSFYRADNDSLNMAPMFCAIVDPAHQVRLNHEHTASEWVSVNDAHTRLMWPSDRQALAEVQSVILGRGMAREHMRIRF